MEVSKMKKLLLVSILVMMALFAGCAKKEEQIDPADLVLVKVETDGIGLTAAAKEGETLEFDESLTSSSVYMNVPKGTILTIGAKDSVDEYKFSRWTKNGENFSTEYEFTVTIDEPTDFVAVFGAYSGWDGPTASTIDEVKVFGDILALPLYGYSLSDNAIVYAFELNGTVYRAIADLDPDTATALNEAFGDSQKFNETLAPVEINMVENVTKAIPSQEELDKYVGKTAGELLDNGWSWTYYNLDEMEFGMEHGWFTYVLKLDGKVENKDDLDIEAAIRDLKVLSVEYSGVGNGVSDLAE